MVPPTIDLATEKTPRLAVREVFLYPYLFAHLRRGGGFL